MALASDQGHQGGGKLLLFRTANRLRAHELYEARGREDGYELEDWLGADEEITAA
jgi:hypothetical protein